MNDFNAKAPMNHCHDCNSDYVTPGTCNCFAPGGKRATLPGTTIWPTPVIPYTPPVIPWQPNPWQGPFITYWTAPVTTTNALAVT